mgnify:FL=1
MLRVRELCASGQNGWEPHTNGIVRMKETKIQICIFSLEIYFQGFFYFYELRAEQKTQLHKVKCSAESDSSCLIHNYVQ